MVTTSNGSKGANRRSRTKAKGTGAARETPADAPARTNLPPLRIILADSEAIFRVGMSRIFAQWKDLEVVAQTETLPQTLQCRRRNPGRCNSLRGGACPQSS